MRPIYVFWALLGLNALGCEGDTVRVGGPCSTDPTIITCEELLAGDVRGDHPTYEVYSNGSQGCESDDLACFSHLLGVPLFEVVGPSPIVEAENLRPLCEGPFGGQVEQLVAEIDPACLVNGSE